MLLFFFLPRNESDEGGDPEKKKFQNQLSGQKCDIYKENVNICDEFSFFFFFTWIPY